MNILIKTAYFDKYDKKIIKAGTEKTVSDERGQELIKKGFAEKVKIKKQNKDEAV